jgi:chorismate-pyruvate lyase
MTPALTQTTGSNRSKATNSVTGCLDPLLDFYRLAKRPEPVTEWISPDQMPVPYRELLVHDSDMTSTLEMFHGESLHLNVLSRRNVGGVIHREVLLLLNSSDRPVEYGAIQIHLDPFPEGCREEILSGQRPLGAILNDSGIAYISQPAGFFQIEPDDFLRKSLQLPKPVPCLFGRRNTLRKIGGTVLAEIVEILPTIES